MTTKGIENNDVLKLPAKATGIEFSNVVGQPGSRSDLQDWRQSRDTSDEPILLAQNDPPPVTGIPRLYTNTDGTPVANHGVAPGAAKAEQKNIRDLKRADQSRNDNDEPIARPPKVGSEAPDNSSGTKGTPPPAERKVKKGTTPPADPPAPIVVPTAYKESSVNKFVQNGFWWKAPVIGGGGGYAVGRHVIPGVVDRSIFSREYWSEVGDSFGQWWHGSGSDTPRPPRGRRLSPLEERLRNIQERGGQRDAQSDTSIFEDEEAPSVRPAPGNPSPVSLSKGQLVRRGAIEYGPPLAAAYAVDLGLKQISNKTWWQEIAEMNWIEVMGVVAAVASCNPEDPGKVKLARIATGWAIGKGAAGVGVALDSHPAPKPDNGDQ